MPPPTDIYVTEDELKAQLGITDAVDNDMITRICHAVSRQIDDYLGATVQPVTTTKYYSPVTPYRVMTDPYTTLTTVEYCPDGTGTTWTVMTGTEEYPYNAPSEGRPYTSVVIPYASINSFPMYERSVRITAVWGHGATVPTAIKEAAIMQASLVMRSQLAGGAPIAGGADYQQTLVTTGLHPFVKQVLNPHRTGATFGMA